MSPSSHGAAARLVTLSGFAVAALFVIGLFLAPPTELLTGGLAAPELAGLYREHRVTVLASVYLASLTWGAVFLVFCGALSRSLVASSEEAAMHAWVGLAGGAVESAMILCFCLFSSLAGYVASGVGPTDVLLLHHTALLANNLSGFPTIVCVAAYTLGLRRAGLLTGWLGTLAGVCVAAHALSTVSLAPAGVLSPSGPASLVAPFTMAAWVLGVAAVLRLSPELARGEDPNLPQ